MDSSKINDDDDDSYSFPIDLPGTHTATCDHVVLVLIETKKSS